MIVILDTGIISIITNPNISQEVGQCKEWLYYLLSKGVYVVTSEICDYETRRGLILANKLVSQSSGIKNLNDLRNVVDFLPVTREVLMKAAEFWAEARTQSQPTANEKNIDVDMILSAQWRLLKDEFEGRYIAIATTNVRHLKLFTEAQEWKNIKI